MNLEQVIATCKALAIAAGKAILEVYATDFAVDAKADNSPLTLADRKANDIIVSGLRGNFPDIAVLSEESKDDPRRLDQEYCFIVDPLDGTKEFVGRNGQFTVNIALAHHHAVVAGVVYAPVSERLFFAWQGGGAFLQTPEPDAPRVVHIQTTDKLSDLTVVGSRSHSSDQEKGLYQAHADLIGCTVSMGSSLKGCLIAAGEADVYYRFGLTREWDTAAMQCIVEEAGGIFRQMDGSPMRYNREDTLNRIGFFAVNRKENIWID